MRGARSRPGGARLVNQHRVTCSGRALPLRRHEEARPGRVQRDLGHGGQLRQPHPHHEPVRPEAVRGRPRVLPRVAEVQLRLVDDLKLEGALVLLLRQPLRPLRLVGRSSRRGLRAGRREGELAARAGGLRAGRGLRRGGGGSRPAPVPSRPVRPAPLENLQK